MKKEIIKRLKRYQLEDNAPLFVIELEGKRLKFNSTKSAWTSLTGAKNALRVVLSTEDLKLIKELEDEGVIKYVQI